MSSDDPRMTDQEPPALSLRGVGKDYRIFRRPQDRLLHLLFGFQRFHDVTALEAIDLEVERGESVGVIGRNGAGKSTLLKLVAGTTRPTRGRIDVGGRVAALLELGTGFNPDFTGRENVYFNAAIHGMPRRRVDERFSAIEAFADIGEFMEDPVRTYSSGMKVRLAFAVIANIDADILIIDEALAVGDALFVQKCMRFLRRFRERGTLFFVSHNPSAVTSLCDRAIYLEGGRLKQTGDSKAVCEAYLADLDAQSDEPSRQGDHQGDGLCTEHQRLAVEAVGRDMRQDLINASSLRNDLLVDPFRPGTGGFGEGSAEIVDAFFIDDTGRPLKVFFGGERVTLVVRACSQVRVADPILGFFLKDLRGQNLFGDNTYLTRLDDPLPLEAGQVLTARFTFRMPLLPPAEYLLDFALAQGTQARHRILCWRHDALVIRSLRSALHHQGIVGLPMESIQLEVERGRAGS